MYVKKIIFAAVLNFFKESEHEKQTNNNNKKNTKTQYIYLGGLVKKKLCPLIPHIFKIHVFSEYFNISKIKYFQNKAELPAIVPSVFRIFIDVTDLSYLLVVSPYNLLKGD